jgi:glycerol-3-phosphate dehydrogenase
MWTEASRQQLLDRLDNSSWDLLIIGGGITGAGIFAEASRSGLKVLLIEQKDFAWGTSSRSSKMIHGGLRYLLQGDLLLTMHAAREREFLMKKYAGLIEPLSFLFPIYQHKKPQKWLVRLGLTLYDLLAGHWNHSFWSTEQVLKEEPLIAQPYLKGAFNFAEAKTDDVRLVLRLLHEGTNEYCYPLNYIKVTKLIQENGTVVGALLKDEEGKEFSIKSSLVINSTGPWADVLRLQISEKPHMRPLRGSHIIFSRDRFPVNHAISFPHPADDRPIFATPWEGVTLVGTTDLDYKGPINDEPAITLDEISYLLSGIDMMFPHLKLRAEEAISTFAGVRPVIDSGKKNPSQELRDHAIWIEHGLMTVTGGKYTTFRLVARDVLKKAETILRNFKLKPEETSPPSRIFSSPVETRLHGYYGINSNILINEINQSENSFVPGTEICWAELEWAVRYESVVHLSDLLLRRTRLGLILPNGANSLLGKIEVLCKKELNWSDDHWKKESQDYMDLIRKNYGIHHLSFNHPPLTGLSS